MVCVRFCARSARTRFAAFKSMFYACVSAHARGQWRPPLHSRCHLDNWSFAITEKTKERRARHNGHFLNARCFFCFARLFYLCGSAASCHDDYEGVIMRWIMHNRATSEDDKWPEELVNVLRAQNMTTCAVGRALCFWGVTRKASYVHWHNNTGLNPWAKLSQWKCFCKIVTHIMLHVFRKDHNEVWLHCN